MKFALIAFLGLASGGLAVPVARGTSESLGESSLATNPELAGLIVADQLIPFEIKNGLGEVMLTGRYQSRVIRSDLTGQLIFVGQIRDTSNPDSQFGWVTNLAMEGFGFVDTDCLSRVDASGDKIASRVTRNAAGDRLNFTISTGFLEPPEETYPFLVITQAREFTSDGQVTIYASNDFGGPGYSITLSGVYAPQKPPLSVRLTDRLFFETKFYRTMEVRGAAQGVRLRVETSPDLAPGSWTSQSGSAATASGAMTLVYGEEEEAFGGKQFFRVVCELPQE
ncbi:MAG: hypothetical protein Q7Q71_00350 [Verrucomicrobiota bacterium JB023]|nr:hypothetical protein [Verrucomicrobiota bacterium JB023]